MQLRNKFNSLFSSLKEKKVHKVLTI